MARILPRELVSKLSGRGIQFGFVTRHMTSAQPPRPHARSCVWACELRPAPFELPGKEEEATELLSPSIF
eukprot:CAMPEP_0194774248 /NCGR_PEP_ID=MMETSP0323_2-20130528/57145_1 /TAXON_ID=2866 ORGANISM="Crypthecodinium cohnii, Strain Seligo" /NCGR_SAMPLE_ID=MMETSP0323_2 /ASSEMBLY_ACC=CAM_ASM_000346 /LENGTH=69 /DNA_ID=CAMNT_0039709711 /DNA_START=18 /DNA_END=227 /DNA_ORIENTATION=-